MCFCLLYFKFFDLCASLSICNYKDFIVSIESEHPINFFLVDFLLILSNIFKFNLNLVLICNFGSPKSSVSSFSLLETRTVVFIIQLAV